MAPAKKKQKNAFYFFMQDLMAEMRAEGRGGKDPIGMAAVVPIAGPRWQELTKQEKDYYERLSKDWKAKKKGVVLPVEMHKSKNTRMDCLGKIISMRKNEFEEQENRRHLESEEVKSQWPPGKEVCNEEFVLINFQTLCTTDSGEYPPLEIGLVKYSMKQGITRELHQFINPGSIPRGYRYEAQLKCEDKHKIPIEKFELAQSNYWNLWNSLMDIVNPHKHRFSPPIYCLSSEQKEVRYCISWLQTNAQGSMDNYLKIFELETLVCSLFAHIGSPISRAQITDLLTTTAFDYEPNTRCSWHEDKCVSYCALGIVRRYAYAISDALAGLYDFQLTEHHLPVKDSKMKGILFQPPHTGFEQPPQSTRSCRVCPEKKAEFFDDASEESSDDDEPIPLRRPNTTPATILHNWKAASFQSDINDKTEFPFLGIARGVPKPVENKPLKFSQTMQSPPLTQLPRPPASWPYTITDREEPSDAVWKSAASSKLSGLQPNPKSTPVTFSLAANSSLGGASQPPHQQASTVSPQINQHFINPPCFQQSVTESTSQSMFNIPVVGRGRGRGMAQVRYQGSLPVGRGYAPPSMVGLCGSVQSIILDNSSNTGAGSTVG